MLGFPPKPTSILPYEEGFNLEDWIVQPKYRGWRGVVHNNEVFTRHGNMLPISTNYPNIHLEYQVDGEIVNPARMTEYGVPTAIKDGTWEIKPIDIYIPARKDMTLLDRLKFMNDELGIAVFCCALTENYDDIFRHVKIFQEMGWEGAVIKRKDSVYKISQYTSIIDHDWFKVK